MSESYVGEIRMFAGNFAPEGWMLCQGQVLAINEYEALFNLIGTTYGGDGRATFALPDLQGRVPIHQSNDHTPGETGGAEAVTLTLPQVPAHAHPGMASVAAATSASPSGARWAATSSPSYAASAPDVDMALGTVTPAGGSQPHENRVPSLGVTFIISMFGIFPPRT